AARQARLRGPLASRLRTLWLLAAALLLLRDVATTLGTLRSRPLLMRALLVSGNARALLSGLRLWALLLSTLRSLLAPPLLLRRYRAPLRALRGLRARTLLLPLAPLLLGCHGSALSARPLLLLAATLLATGALALLTCSLQFACSSRSLGRMG